MLFLIFYQRRIYVHYTAVSFCAVPHIRTSRVSGTAAAINKYTSIYVCVYRSSYVVWYTAWSILLPEVITESW
jgi:hypothetical protein